MAHDRNMPKKARRKPKVKGKRQKGLPPHLQQSGNNKSDSVRQIQEHIDTVAQRTPSRDNT